METGAILTITVPVVVAIITTMGTIWVARRNTKTDIQATVNSGFKDLTDQLQEERAELSAIIARQRQEAADKDRHVAELERLLRDARRRQGRLLRALRRAGVKVPAADDI